MKTKKIIYEIGVVLFILFLIVVFVWNGIRPSIRELTVSVNANNDKNDVELLLVSKSIIYNFSFNNNVPTLVEELTLPLKFNITSNNGERNYVFTQKDIQSFADIYIVHEPLSLMKKKDIDIMSSFSKPLPLAYKEIGNDQIKVVYCIAPDSEVSSFTKKEIENGIKVANAEILKEEIASFIQQFSDPAL